MTGKWNSVGGGGNTQGVPLLLLGPLLPWYGVKAVSLDLQTSNCRAWGRTVRTVWPCKSESGSARAHPRGVSRTGLGATLPQ